MYITDTIAGYEKIGWKTKEEEKKSGGEIMACMNQESGNRLMRNWKRVSYRKM